MSVRRTRFLPALVLLLAVLAALAATPSQARDAAPQGVAPAVTRHLSVP